MDYQADIAIIGAGPSGLFMAFEAGFLGYQSIVLDAQPQPGGQLAALYPEKPIYDIPGYPKVVAGQLVNNLLEQAAPFNPTYLLGEAATSLTETPEGFEIQTDSHKIRVRAVVVAGGGGMFTPRKPAQVANLEYFEKQGEVVYAITNKAAMKGQTVVIAGGGDSAVDWVNELAHVAEHVHVVHRRPDFRAAEESVRQMEERVKAGKVTLHTPFQLLELKEENGKLAEVVIADTDGAFRTLKADRLVCCFGLAPNAGPLAEWGLGLEKGIIPVNRTTMETARKNVLCIGDMADYEGKVALILTGFAEAAVAGKTLQSILNPEKKFKVSYSTSKGVPGQVPQA